MNTVLKEIWQSGADSEVEFWEEWLKTKGSDWPEEYIYRTNLNSQLQEYLIKYLPSDKTIIDILDVGSGPLTFLGKKIKNKNTELRITSTDPLADKYLKMLRQHNITPGSFFLNLSSEELSTHLLENYFDLVYMRNALDHCLDPLTSIGEMIKVLNKNSYLILEHKMNEAISESYTHLHQWNISIEDSEFIIWNKSVRYNISEQYKSIAEITCLYATPWGSNTGSITVTAEQQNQENIITENYNLIEIKKK